MKSPRNKTIDFSLQEGKPYLERCISLTEPQGLDAVLDKTILGDAFAVLDLLPPQFR